MEDKVILALISLVGVIITSAFSYMKGQNNPKVDKFKAIEDAYKSFIDIVQKDNEKLRARVLELEQKLAAQ